MLSDGAKEVCIMPTSHDRILTTHVGSLVRPPALSRYIEAIDNGVKIDQAAFDRCLADSVTEVVKRQQQAGIDVVGDGEFGKFRSWSFYVLDRLGGIEEHAVEAARGAGRDQLMFRDFYAEYFPSQKLPKRARWFASDLLPIKVRPPFKRTSLSSRRR
jgi:5-methyltetrahydropteroyltriglutamate--homocysteine methyltransferase